jgi:alpha-1,6-mannosyltransferase
MKICDIVQFYSEISGGVKRYIDDKILYYANQPNVSHILIIPSHRNAVRTKYNTRIYEMKSHPLIGSSSYRLLISRNRIADVIQSEQPHLIEIGDPYQSAWIAHRIARKNNIPIIAYYHSDYPRALGRTLQKIAGRWISEKTERLISRYLTHLYNKMDATIVATPQFEKLLHTLGIQRIHQIALGTNTHRFHPADQKKQLLSDYELPPETFLLVYVGRIAREKNILQLIRMMDLFDNQPPIALLIVGDGEQVNTVQRIARQHDRIFWHPYCSSSELLSVLYSAADAFIHPSTSETFGLVSIEAQACGTPVIAVRNGGLDYTLSHEPEPILAQSKKAIDLYRAVCDIQRRQESQQDRIERRKRIIQTFGHDTTCAQLVHLYQTTIEQHRQQQFQNHE